MKKSEACPDCNAEYTLNYKLDKDYYQPQFCAFCGTRIADEAYDVEVPEDE